MRVSIQAGGNSQGNICFKLSEEEVEHLGAGWPEAAGRPKLNVQGDVARGLRLAFDSRVGRLLQPSGRSVWAAFPANIVKSTPDPISPVDVPCNPERDDTGPILKTACLPDAFIPRSLRGIAQQTPPPPLNLRKQAEALFESGGRVVSSPHPRAPWDIQFCAVKGKRERAAVVKCSCGAGHAVRLAHNLPDEVVMKKIREAGWRANGDTFVCPACVIARREKPAPSPLAILPKAANMAEVIDRVVDGKIGQLLTAASLMNDLLKEINDPEIRVVWIKGQVELQRVSKLCP